MSPILATYDLEYRRSSKGDAPKIDMKRLKQIGETVKPSEGLTLIAPGFLVTRRTQGQCDLEPQEESVSPQVISFIWHDTTYKVSN